MGVGIGTPAILTHPALAHAQARAIKHPPTTPAATCRHPSGIVKPAGVQVRTATGTVARATEMIAEIHNLGDYLGELRCEVPKARDATEDRSDPITEYVPIA